MARAQNKMDAAELHREIHSFLGPMKAYVAGKFSDKATVQGVHEKVRQKGYNITHDWTTHEPSIASKTKEDYAQDAIEDVQGVVDADVCVFLFTDPAYPYRGTFTELGMALALKKKIIAYYPDPLKSDVSDKPGYLRCCFLHHPLVKSGNTLDEIYGLI